MTIFFRKWREIFGIFLLRIFANWRILKFRKKFFFPCPFRHNRWSAFSPARKGRAVQRAPRWGKFFQREMRERSAICSLNNISSEETLAANHFPATREPAIVSNGTYWNSRCLVWSHGVVVKSSRCMFSDRSSNLVWRIIWIHTLSKFKDAEKEIVQSFYLRVFGGNGAIG